VLLLSTFIENSNPLAFDSQVKICFETLVGTFNFPPWCATVPFLILIVFALITENSSLKLLLERLFASAIK